MLISANIALFSWFWIHCDAWLWELNGRLFERALLKTSALSCLCKLKSALRIKVSAYAIWFCDEYSIIYHLNASDSTTYTLCVFFFFLRNLAPCAKEIIINSSDVLILISASNDGKQKLDLDDPRFFLNVCIGSARNFKPGLRVTYSSTIWRNYPFSPLE